MGSFRKELARLKFEHGCDDPLAALLAFLLCHDARKSVPRWAADAVASRLRHDLKRPKTQAKAEISRGKEFARWFTVDYYRRQGCLEEESYRFAALAYGGEETAEGYVEGQSTMEHAWKSFRRRRNLPSDDHKESIPEGFENFTPLHLPEGPKHLPLPPKS